MDLFLQRILAAFDNTPAPMRKAMTHKEGLVAHQCCGAFVHFLSELEKIAPPAEYQEAATSLTSQFGFGYLDPDLLHGLESSVPPGDVRSVSAFRPFHQPCCISTAHCPTFQPTLKHIYIKHHDNRWGGE